MGLFDLSKDQINLHWWEKRSTEVVYEMSYSNTKLSLIFLVA